MAWIKDKMTKSGRRAEYHRPGQVRRITFDRKQREARVSVEIESFWDADTRWDGARPAEVNRETVRLSEEQTQELQRLLYAALGEREEWQDAEVRDPDPERTEDDKEDSDDDDSDD